MTKSDSASSKKGGRQGTRITVQFSDDIIQKVKEERDKQGINTDSPVYQQALKFYFENKDKHIFLSQEELDAYVNKKLDSLLSDTGRLDALANAVKVRLTKSQNGGH